MRPKEEESRLLHWRPFGAMEDPAESFSADSPHAEIGENDTPIAS